MNLDYVHGYSASESTRLTDQATTLTELLHVDTHYPPGSLVLEGRFPETTRRSLAERGHRVRLGDTWSGGRLTACAREQTPEGVVLKAGANPRGMQTYAVGR